MKAVKCPSDELSLTNKAIVNNGDFADDTRWVIPYQKRTSTSILRSSLIETDHVFPLLVISKCQLVLDSILCLQYIGHQKCQKAALDSHCCRENGQHCRSIKILMWNRTDSIRPVRLNACAISPWKLISCRKNRMINWSIHHALDTHFNSTYFK